MSALPLLRPPRPRGAGPADAARPELRVVSRARHGRRYLLLGLALSAVAVFGCVALNALAAEQAFAARTLQGQVGELALRADELTAEVARLESPARVHRVAVSRLGMVPAQRPAFLSLGQPHPGAETPRQPHGKAPKGQLRHAAAPGGQD